MPLKSTAGGDKAVLILNLGKKWWGSGQLHTLANLNLGKTPILHQRCWVSPRDSLDT